MFILIFVFIYSYGVLRLSFIIIQSRPLILFYLTLFYYALFTRSVFVHRSQVVSPSSKCSSTNLSMLLVICLNTPGVFPILVVVRCLYLYLECSLVFLFQCLIASSYITPPCSFISFIKRSHP